MQINAFILPQQELTTGDLEGSHNELGSSGYHRDGKKGKLQIVIGLLFAHKSDPGAVQRFTQNTSAVTTFSDQVRNVADRLA